MKPQSFHSVLVIIFAAFRCGLLGLKAQDYDRNYRLTTVMSIKDPADLNDMNDAKQKAVLLNSFKGGKEVRITYSPYSGKGVSDEKETYLSEQDLESYLMPTPSENWDANMREDLLKELSVAGIDVRGALTREMITKVARWATLRSRDSNTFFIWAIYYPGGIPAIFPPLKAAILDEQTKLNLTDQQVIDLEGNGRAMFYSCIHGSCTSYAIYQATIMRALGLPTRFILCIPPYDPNDSKQKAQFFGKVRNEKVDNAVLKALDGKTGFIDHVMNEVYIDHRWLWLNYSRLGEPRVDRNYLGLLTHIATFNSVSRFPLAETWGRRFFLKIDSSDAIKSLNPFVLERVETESFLEPLSLPR